MNRPLTPYDTGARLAPMVVISPDRRRPLEHDTDRYGRVDFENDESVTITTVYVERDPDVGYVLHTDAEDDVKIVRGAITPDMVRKALRRALEASQGTSGDDPIEALQECRDLLAEISGFTAGGDD